MSGVRRGWLLAGLAVVVLVTVFMLRGLGGGDAGPLGTDAANLDRDTGLVWVDEARLPAEARATLALIDRGGPYPYAKDGVVFRNAEGLLPRRDRGFYHEYTVRTPGSRDRGARRIITGDGTRWFFYTADHYATFARIRR